MPHLTGTPTPRQTAGRLLCWGDKWLPLAPATHAAAVNPAPQPLAEPRTLTLFIGRQGRVTTLLLHLPQDLQVALLGAPLPLLGGAGRGRALLPVGKGRAAPAGHFQEVLGRPDGGTSALTLVRYPL